jgi:hypothetical protein
MKKLFAMYLVLLMVFELTGSAALTATGEEAVSEYIHEDEYVSAYVITRYHGFEADGDTREYMVYEYLLGDNDMDLNNIVVAYATVDGELYDEPARAMVCVGDDVDMSSPKAAIKSIEALAEKEGDYEIIDCGWMK